MKHKLLLLLMCLSVLSASPALSAQIGGKALGDVADVVKEATHGSLEIPKYSLMLLRGGGIEVSQLSPYDNRYYLTSYNYLQSNIMAFNSAGNTAMKTLQAFREQLHDTNPELLMNIAPVISRKSYNGKRVVMNSTSSPATIRTYFSALQNSRTATTETPQDLVNALSESSIGDPYVTKLQNYYAHMFGGIVLNVKGYDGEVFVDIYAEEKRSAWTGKTTSFNVTMNFFGVNADSSGEPAPTKLDLSSTMNFSDASPRMVSMAATDIDDDGYVDDFAVLVNSNLDVRLYFYKVVYENGTFKLKRHGNNEYKLHTTSIPYSLTPSDEASSALVAGDFDGDGKFEVAALYKTIKREKSDDNKHNPDGWIVGDVSIHIFKWDFNKGTFESKSNSKTYSHHRLALTTVGSEFAGKTSYHKEFWSGIAGLKAAAADLDGDGKDEIVTLLIGQDYYNSWDPKWKIWTAQNTKFNMYPYLAVWSCPRGLITPQHDENHVKGQGIEEGPLAEYGAKSSSLFGESLWYFKSEWEKWPGQSVKTSASGRLEPKVETGYTQTYFSMAVGPFTGTLGVGKTVDDVVVSWNSGWDCDGNTKVYLFKTNVSNGSFSGFSNASKIADISKNAPQEVKADETTGMIWHALFAADFAGEGVELDVPVHVKDTGDRSYIAILNAPPYHVDTVDENGNSLQQDPHNFTYSGGSGDGSMEVFYDNKTANETTKAVTFDLSNSVETILMSDNENIQNYFGPSKKLLSFASNLAFKSWDGGNWVNAAMDAITDKIDTTDTTVKTSSKTVILNDNLRATTRDSIIFYNADRHIWRYPILTEPVPEWLLSGSRIDSTSGDISTVKGDASHYLTFAMYDDGTKYTMDSVSDTEMKYQPLHEEGNFFSYPPSVAANEGYIPGAVLTNPIKWSFGTAAYTTSATFKDVSADERQTDKTVTRSTATTVIEAVNKFVQGDNAASLTPETDNPQKFSKSYSKEEQMGFALKGRSSLVNRGAGHELAFQVYTGKEGAMTFATAVTLASQNAANTLWRSSIYTEQADPALMLPLKFIEDESKSNFVKNTNDVAAMQMRGMRFYLPELLSYTDNRLICGLDYEIRVPVYNASFKATGNFTSQLSYSTENTPTATKIALATVTTSLNGWSNDSNANKGWLVFKVPGSATQNIASGNYYLWVDLDTGHAVDEVHESRMADDQTTVVDYGGNNNGYTAVVFVNMNNGNKILSKSNKTTTTTASVSSAGFVATAEGEVEGNKTTITTYITMNGMHNMADIETFLKSQPDTSMRIPVSCEVTYEGEYTIPYASLTGYHVSNSSAKLAAYGYNLVNIPKSEKEGFTYSTFAMIPGKASKFYLMLCADDIVHPADSDDDTLTYFEISIPGFDVDFNWPSEGKIDILLGDDTVEDVYAYLADVASEISADAPEVGEGVVTVLVSQDFRLTKNSDVLWRISSVKLRGSELQGSEETEYLLDTSISRVHSVDLSGMDTSFDENVDMSEVYSMFKPDLVPDNGVVVSVRSVPYVTKRGVYEIQVQTSTGGVFDEDGNGEEVWNDEATLVFDVSAGSGGSSSSGVGSSGGCNFGLGMMVAALIFFRRRR